MIGRGSWIAPAFAMFAVAVTVGIDLWRGSPAPLPAPAVPIPAVADHVPLAAEAWRDPFQVKVTPQVVPREIESPPRPASPAASRSPAPEPRAASPSPPASPPASPPPVPPYPVYSGTLVGDGRPALVLEDGLAPVGQRIGPWTVVTVEFDRVILETKHWRVTLDPEGKELAPPERRK